MRLSSLCYRTIVFFMLTGFLFLFNVFFVRNASAQFGNPPPHPQERFNRESGPDNGKGGFVSRLDKDGDNRVSRQEFDGPPEHFDVLDQNNDGFLSEQERPPFPPPGHRPPGSRRIEPDTQAVSPQNRQAKILPQPSPPASDFDHSSPDSGRIGLTPGQNNETQLAQDRQPEPASRMQPVPGFISENQGNVILTPETTRATAGYPWFWVVFIAAVVALVLALIWGLYSFRQFKQVRDAVASLDPHLLGVNLDNNIIITEVTEALCRATGFRYRDLVGKPLMALGSHMANKPGAMQDMWNKIQKGSAWKGEVKLIRKNGSVIWADAVISPLRRRNEKSSGYTVFYQDVSQRKHFEKLSMRDELTRLFNRRYFNEVAAVVLKKTRRERNAFVLGILDVDNFKKYNDTYGHPAGDRVLTAIGGTLMSVFQRKDDMVFRLGGEEFGAIFTVNEIEEATVIADRMLQEIRNLQIQHEKNPPGIVTVSIGLKIVAENENSTMDTIYKKADQALYEAKETGRDKVVIALS